MAYSRAYEYSDPEQTIARYSKIAAHPARLRILDQLSAETLTLCELCEDHPIPRTTIMRHLNVLIKHHLVTVESQGFPATYSANKEHWPSFVSYAVRLANRFTYANAA